MASSRTRRWRERLHCPAVCPNCNPTVIIVGIGEMMFPENEEHAPGFSTLHLCQSCGAKLKRLPQFGRWTEPGDDDLKNFPTAEEIDQMQKSSEPSELTPVGIIMFLGTGLLSFFVAFRVGINAYLIWCYDLIRIITENLWIVDTSQERPWVVSNGDRIANGELFTGLVAMPLGLVLFIALSCIIWRLSPWKLERPMDETTRQAQERGDAIGERVLLLGGTLMILVPLAILFIIWLIV